MRSLSRRAFLINSSRAAAAGLALPLLPAGWYALAGAGEPGYFEKEFGITDVLCRKVLAQALSRGGDYADLFFEHTISNTLSLEDGKVNRAYSEVALGVGIRTVMGDQVGYGFTQQLTEPALLAAAATAAAIASGPARQPAGQLVATPKGNFYPLDRLLEEVPLPGKVNLVQSVYDCCAKRSSLLVKINATFSDEQKRIMIVTSEGSKSEDLQPRTYLATNVIAEKNGRREQYGWNAGGRQPFSYFTPAVVETLAEKTVNPLLTMFSAVQPPAGEMPVVIGPGVTAILLHEAIGHGMEADFNRKNLSTYCTMIGRKVAEPFVTIVDDGTIPRMLGSINVDDEGIAGQRTVLVDKGILTSYLHDRISAKHYKLKPTGNGRRESYQHYIQPRMRNTIMLAGSATPEEVIKAAGKGLYVEDVSNGEVNIGPGDFAFYISQGRLIEDGKLTAPVKDINIMGNGPKMLANTIMAANDLSYYQGGGAACGKGGQSVPVGFGQPTILVKSLTVGGVKA